jgi:hypothetical protein
MVKYGAWPLYYFAKDTKPGDTTGQGVQGVWYVVGVDGQPIIVAGRPQLKILLACDRGNARTVAIGNRQALSGPRPVEVHALR